MKSKVIKFLDKLLADNNVSEDIYNDALKLYNDLGPYKKVDIEVFHIVPPISCKPKFLHKDTVYCYNESDVETCKQNAIEMSSNRNLGKIRFIKALRAHYGIGLKEAKDFSDWLEEKGLITFIFMDHAMTDSTSNNHNVFIVPYD
jgi:hypothetical protein